MRGVGPGTVLGGRYTVRRRLEQLHRTERWSADDTTLGRTVSILCMAGDDHRTPALLDAARRAASVTHGVFVRILDVGSDDDVAFVVEEDLGEASTFAELVTDGGVPGDEVRRITGEVAAALESARQRGMHHLDLKPEDVLRTPDGDVRVRGLETAAVRAGEDGAEAEDAARRDAVGVVALAYAGLTGLWPLGAGGSGLGTAPRVPGGVAAPSEIAAGVPRDLDAICRLTLNDDQGPTSPGDYARQVAPWPSRQVVGRATAHSPRPAPVPDATPDRGADADDGGSDAGTPALGAAAVGAAAVGVAAGASVAAGRREVPPPPADTVTFAADHGGPAPVGASDTLEQPVLPTVATPAAGEAGGTAVLPASGSVDDDVRATQDDAGDDHEAAGFVGDDLDWLRSDRGARAETTVVEHHPDLDDPYGIEPAEGSRSTTAAVGAAGAGAAVAGALGTVGGRVGGFARRAVDKVSELSPDTAPRTSEDGLEAPAPLVPAEPLTKDESKLALGIVAGFVVLALVLGIWGVSRIGANSGDVLGDSAAPATRTTTVAPSTPAPTGSASEPADGATAAEPLAILKVEAYDPEGDGAENNKLAPKVYDGDKGTGWSSENYRSNQFGGLKDGVGVIVDLGPNKKPQSVELDVPVAGDVEVYVGPDNRLEGATKIGEEKDAEGTVTFDVPDDVSGQYIVVWFTGLTPDDNGKRRARLDEVVVTG